MSPSPQQTALAPAVATARTPRDRPWRAWLRIGTRLGSRVGVQSWGLAGLFFAAYCVLSVRRYQRMQASSFDLGIFEQGVSAYAHGHLPVSLLKGPGFDLLGDHFHPLLAVFAPFYRLFPTPLTLLVGQAALSAVAIVPLVRWAHRVRGPKVSAWIGLTFGASWGMAELNHFDFHEVCLAVPLLAFALAAAGRRRWRAAAAWGLPLLLVKEDLGLTLAMLGGFMAWKGAGKEPRRIGLALVAVGILGTALEMLVLLPSVNAHGSFDYWNEISSGSVQPSAVPVSPLVTFAHTFWPLNKYGTVLMLLAPTAFTALRSPLVLLILPTLAWRFVSANPNYWGTLYHYSAVLMPIVFAAAIHALDRDRAVLRGRLLRWLCAASVVFTAVTIPIYPLHEVVLPRTWTTPGHVRVAERILAQIPDGATVATSNRIGTRLTGRAQVSLICSTNPPRTPPEWVLFDSSDPTEWPCSLPTMAAEVSADQASGYVLVTRQDGITLLRRR